MDEAMTAARRIKTLRLVEARHSSDAVSFSRKASESTATAQGMARVLDVWDESEAAREAAREAESAAVAHTMVLAYRDVVVGYLREQAAIEATEDRSEAASALNTMAKCLELAPLSVGVAS